MNNTQLPPDVKRAFKNNQPSILSTIGNAIKKAFGYLIDVTFGRSIVQDANADKIGFFKSLRNRHLSVNLSDASKVQGNDRMLIGNNKHLQYFCNTTKAMANMPGTDIVVVNTNKHGFQDTATKEEVKQLSFDNNYHSLKTPDTHVGDGEIQFLIDVKADYFEPLDTCKIASWNLLTNDKDTPELICSKEHISDFILNLFDSIEEKFKDPTSKELTLAVQMPIFKSDNPKKSNELTERFLDYFELARMEFATRLDKKITIKLYRNPDTDTTDKDQHDKDLTDISKLLNKKRNNSTTKNVQTINRRLTVVTDYLETKGPLTQDTNSASATAPTQDTVYDSDSDSSDDDLAVTSGAPVTAHGSVSDKQDHILKLSQKTLTDREKNCFLDRTQLQIPTLTNSKFTRINEHDQEVMLFGIRFYQQNNGTNLQEQLSHSGHNIEVETFDSTDNNVTGIEATNDVMNFIIEKAKQSSFANRVSKGNILMLQEIANDPVAPNVLVFSRKVEFEVKPPSFNQMKGETNIEKGSNYIDFVLKLNSELQYMLAELIASNNDTIKNNNGESIKYCRAIVDIIFTLDPDTVEGLKTVFPFGSGVVETLNALATCVHSGIPQDNS